MKKFLFILFCFLLIFPLIMYFLIFTPLPSQLAKFAAPPMLEKGPIVFYRVFEGAVDVFSLQNGRVTSLLNVVRPGENLTARKIPDAETKIPLWLEWLEPAMIEVIEVASDSIYKIMNSSSASELAIGFTDRSIEQSYAKFLMRSRIFSSLHLTFESDGFSINAAVHFIPISVRGYASTHGTSNRLFLHLRWLKVGAVFLPEHTLRALESIFAAAYVKSSRPSVKLLRIVFDKGSMILYCMKETFMTNYYQAAGSQTEPKMIFPLEK